MSTHFDAAQNADFARAFLPPDVASSAPEKLCRKLARTHYENFHVGSLLLPKRLRRHVYNIYAYCRVCDDLADETGDRELSLRLLGWWREELHACFQGWRDGARRYEGTSDEGWRDGARRYEGTSDEGWRDALRQAQDEARRYGATREMHPVFQALRETVESFDLPIEPFGDLISAFEQDQRVTRYATFDELLGYCERSANPVGRLFLCLLGYRDEARQRLSDLTCTALQLANFWQDIASDYARGRIYIPQEDMERFGYSEPELANHVRNASFLRMMRFEIERTRELFERGAALHGLIPGPGAADVALFTAGGMGLLHEIERAGCNVFRKRITVPAASKALMLAGWCGRRLLRQG